MTRWAGLACALLTIAPAAAASPPDWYLAHVAPEVAPQTFGGRDLLLERVAPPRLAVTPVGMLDVDALPHVETEPDATFDAWGPRPAVLPDSIAEAPELIVLGAGALRTSASAGVRIALRGERLGRIEHRFAWEGEARPGQRGGASSDCGGEGRIDPLTWIAVRLIGDGNIEVARGAGWFDGPRCRVVVVQRTVAIAAPIHGGQVYAFTGTCPRCTEDARERLHLVRTTLADDMRRRRDRLSSDGWELTHSVLAIGPGTSGSTEMFLVGTAARFVERTRLVVDAQRTDDEPRATVLLYARRVPERPFF